MIRGSFGDGTTTSRLTPVSVTGLSSGVASVIGNEGSWCALLTSGAVKCWLQLCGHVGNGSTDESSSVPVAVSGLTTGGPSLSGSGNSWCAVLMSGAARCWGLNDDGQLGNGSTRAPTSQCRSPAYPQASRALSRTGTPGAPARRQVDSVLGAITEPAHWATAPG